eukprot:scaffold20381_cov75-Skeletonema_dohrnii-CCMP3373.AAC.4
MMHTPKRLKSISIRPISNVITNKQEFINNEFEVYARQAKDHSTKLLVKGNPLALQSPAVGTFARGMCAS